MHKILCGNTFQTKKNTEIVPTPKNKNEISNKLNLQIQLLNYLYFVLLNTNSYLGCVNKYFMVAYNINDNYSFYEDIIGL